MPIVADRASPTAATQLPSRGLGLISRIASPFTAAKSRFIVDFFIEVDDPHRQYNPGDTVPGSVRLRIVRPVRVTHLVVCLHGYAQVFKNPSAPPDSYKSVTAYAGPGKGRKNGEYFGNGFATLFEDEVVLCGDGRLGEGWYEFKFNLEFPERDLPSSITFERGTISYLITATLTRPTTISPTLQCEHAIYFVERIDIAGLLPISARTITLEPIPRKVKTKSHARRLAESSSTERKNQRNDAASVSRRASQNSSTASSHAEGERPRSPAASEMSQGSQDSSGGGTASRQGSNASPRQSDAGKANGSRVSLPTKTITATVEPLTGGCLRGDFANVKVTVSHTKHVKSLYGVIITLYRQAKVDLHPPIPMPSSEKGKSRFKGDDYYPRSITGLGGLSLSGAGSAHVFRKDLSQIILPLIVDPTTRVAEVHGKVRIPEEAFPTIATVPAGMISFRYYVEVIVDVQAKLSTPDRNMGNLGGFASTINQSQAENHFDRERSSSTPFGSQIIDTASIRRDKSIVSSTFEVVVGTNDSKRRKGKQVVKPQSTDAAASPPPPASQIATASQPVVSDASQSQQAPDPLSQYPHAPPPGTDVYHYGNGYWYEGGSDPNYFPQWNAHYDPADPLAQASEYAYPPNGYPHAPPLVPPPPQIDDSQLSEKDRIRQAEARLLPSAPPVADEDTNTSDNYATNHNFAATAPYIPPSEDEDFAPEQDAPNSNNRLSILPSVQFLLTPPSTIPGSSTHPTPSYFASAPPPHDPYPLPRTPEYEVSPSSSFVPNPSCLPSETRCSANNERAIPRPTHAPASSSATPLDINHRNSITPTPTPISSQSTHHLPHPISPSNPLLGIEISPDDIPVADESVMPPHPPTLSALSTHTHPIPLTNPTGNLNINNDTHGPTDDDDDEDDLYAPSPRRPSINDSHADASAERTDLPRYEQ